MTVQSLYHTFQRYRTLQTDRVSSLPIVILMPHSACNCRCVMCDIWKDNKNLKQLTENDISGLLETLKKFGTRQVVMSGGEALLNPNFFRFCEMLKKTDVKISLLSTGLLLKNHALQIVDNIDDIILSLDGDELLHDRIRNVPGAFRKLREGVDSVRKLQPDLKITARTVIHRLNFRNWAAIIDTANNIGLNQISFLPADVSSHAFNREVLWTEPRQHEILIQEKELPELKAILELIVAAYKTEFDEKFIAETPDKLRKIYDYYAAFYGLNDFPYKRCNAPWVSAVIESDGTVKPCFFHEAIGNMREQPLDRILNSEEAIHFRKTLDMETNSTCRKCVCSINLTPKTKL
ncbi:MAG: radical SAM protein [Chitinophagaceae bacterium]|nr:radical SAM protein [Chitinophagaceae bacterium]